MELGLEYGNNSKQWMVWMMECGEGDAWTLCVKGGRREIKYCSEDYVTNLKCCNMCFTFTNITIEVVTGFGWQNWPHWDNVKLCFNFYAQLASLMTCRNMFTRGQHVLQLVMLSCRVLSVCLLRGFNVLLPSAPCARLDRWPLASPRLNHILHTKVLSFPPSKQCLSGKSCPYFFTIGTVYSVSVVVIFFPWCFVGPRWPRLTSELIV